jgi:ubiquitin-like protein Pup
VIDDIDGVLEENAEEFVKSYVQRAGEWQLMALTRRLGGSSRSDSRAAKFIASLRRIDRRDPAPTSPVPWRADAQRLTDHASPAPRNARIAGPSGPPYDPRP